jgi:glycine/D-amino acid oxidase-like deaminating enzyme
MQKHHLSVDFCVVGGGMAGTLAALAAARNGATVALLQDRSVLGGNASSEVRMHVVGANTTHPGAREGGILEELRLDDAYRNPQRAYPLWDLLLYEKVKAEPNITLLLDTTCTGCGTETIDAGIVIRKVHAVRNLTEDEFEIEATFFADCSGDGRLGFEAGAHFKHGREAKQDHNEELAQDVADNKTLGSTILLSARKHDQPMPFVRPDWVRQFTKEDLRNRTVLEYCYGFWWAEWGGQLDTIKDNDVIRHELYRIALGLWDYIKNSGEHPDSANWALDWIGGLPGKRESRRFIGEHVLTQHDLLGGTVFPDQVAYGGWPLDLHVPEGIDAIDKPANIFPHLPHLYSIPLRALYSENIKNLFFAGRNMSATHAAFGSTRVMATCAVMGQGIGTAAARGIRAKRVGTEVLCADLAREPYISAIQQTLLRDDAFLLGIKNEDPCDLARGATVVASCEAEGWPANAIIDGTSRFLKNEWGSWSDDSGHGWRSRAQSSWIELRFAAPVLVTEVHLTFDTGFERFLTLTASDHFNRKIQRGPQPEVAKEYRLMAGDEVVTHETSNWQRKRIHRFDLPLLTDRLRLQVDATHGASEARLFEMRIY